MSEGYGEALELKPCPSPPCGRPGGEEGPVYKHRGFTLHSCVWIECGCGMRGPEGRTSDEAQRLWNELPRTAEAEALKEIHAECMNSITRISDILDSHRRVGLGYSWPVDGALELPEADGEDDE